MWMPLIWCYDKEVRNIYDAQFESGTQSLEKLGSFDDFECDLTAWPATCLTCPLVYVVHKCNALQGKTSEW